MRDAQHYQRFVAFTIGDINGIGPEVVLRTVSHLSRQSATTPLLVGPPGVFSQYARRLGLSMRFERLSLPGMLDWKRSHLRGSVRAIPVVELSRVTPVVRPGHVSRLAGRVAARAIETAVTLLHMGVADVLVTAPVSKRALHSAGIGFSGQTEMLQSLTHSPRVGMMMVSPTMRIGLVTIHIPIKDVAARLSQHLLEERIQVFRHALITDFRLPSPRLAVLGLNPHAGEEGDLGTEEQRIITPVLDGLRADGLAIEGPFPSDAFFARYRAGKYDAVIAMYHDQGLIPLKMRARERAVNVTVGLPIVRTSPAHGTAFDIAGTLTADPGSMIEAVAVALRISANRQTTSPERTGQVHGRGKKGGRRR